MELPEDTIHSFIVRIWLEEPIIRADEAVWRGHITHVPSGEKHYLSRPDDILRFVKPYLEKVGVGPGIERSQPVESIFSFFRDKAADSDEAPPEMVAAELAPVAPPSPTPANELSFAIHANSNDDSVARSPEEALGKMLDELRAILDDIVPPPLPNSRVSVTSVMELPLAIGNQRGAERLGSFASITLKGGRLDALVRFELWADSPAAVDDAVDTLHGALLAANDDLFAHGFLRITAEGTTLSEHVTAVDAWRKSASYRILYEFHFEDSDGAESLIARIPIDIDAETDQEFTLVTDEMVRWDNEVAPALVVRGRHTIGVLTALVFAPGPPPSSPITLTRTNDSATGPPTPFATLAEFVAAITDPLAPNRHGQVIFPTLTEFLAQFTAVGNPVFLGDWNDDQTLDSYQASLLSFDPLIQLPGAADRLELVYQDDAFDQIAVVYLRATPL
ncbi:MAG: hypothetical protein JSW55_09825 [Chloroflexota bacterium]|nr:MAG: hypothetical protein JSW55_09825 [Chloroflexota bacterium]